MQKDASGRGLAATLAPRRSLGIGRKAIWLSWRGQLEFYTHFVIASFGVSQPKGWRAGLLRAHKLDGRSRDYRLCGVMDDMFFAIKVSRAQLPTFRIDDHHHIQGKCRLAICGRVIRVVTAHEDRAAQVLLDRKGPLSLARF